MVSQRRMQCLTEDEFHTLSQNAQVLSRDQFGDKVLLCADGTIIKLFRRKRLLSSALFRPYALRFAAASQRLKAMKIPSVDVKAVFRIPSIRRHAVQYPRLPGTVFREAIRLPERRERLMPRLAELLATLHEKGVFFRAVHFGNILVRDDESLALIDISEAKFKSRALRSHLRAVNFKQLVGYPEDEQAIKQFGAERFLQRYLARATLSADEYQALLTTMARNHSTFAETCRALEARGTIV